MAGKLRLMVDNSLIVPAISEFPLDIRHRRHWNLLRKAQACGVKLFVTKQTIEELSAHINKSIESYSNLYEEYEEFYIQEKNIKYVDEILVRSYFYGENAGVLETYEEFIDNFLSPRSQEAARELLMWLKGTFGIELLNMSDLMPKIDSVELEQISNELSKV